MIFRPIASCSAALFVMFAVVASASAQDVWTDPAPGIRQLVRTAPGPVRYVAVTVDISRPEYFIRATRPDEASKRTSTWANEVGAVVAINGDWINFDTNRPVGLAVGDDQHWPGTADNAWSFMACTLEKRCTFDDHTTNQERHPLWREVVGGNGWRLLIDGNMPQYPNDSFYTADRHPRSGVGMSADGKTMYFAVAEGRLGDSIGVAFTTFSDFFQSLGAHNAMMLDGGGSSTLVVNGSRLNRLPSGQSSERVVINHLGILRGTASAECTAVPNGRYCDGSVIHTCQGGQYRGNGDCGAFGASCAVTDDGVGVCVHPYCTGGPNGSYCEDANRITTCDYGMPGGTGDCSAYGATCETGTENAYCVHPECTEGGNVSWCTSDTVLSTCVDGQPQEDVDCVAQGFTCSEGSCVDPSTGDPVGPVDPGKPVDPVDPGDPDDPDVGDSVDPDDEDAGDDPEEELPAVVESDGRAGCATASAGFPAPAPVGLLSLVAILWAVTRRRSGTTSSSTATSPPTTSSKAEQTLTSVCNASPTTPLV